jgi:hypothetical protein
MRDSNSIKPTMPGGTSQVLFVVPVDELSTKSLSPGNGDLLGICISKKLPIGAYMNTEARKWCAIQGSNLLKAAISLGNSQGDAQGNAQMLVALGRELSQVVTDWAKLPTPLKAAVLAIISSTKGQP